MTITSIYLAIKARLAAFVSGLLRRADAPVDRIVAEINGQLAVLRDRKLESERARRVSDKLSQLLS